VDQTTGAKSQRFVINDEVLMLGAVSSHRDRRKLPRSSKERTMRKSFFHAALVALTALGFTTTSLLAQDTPPPGPVDNENQQAEQGRPDGAPPPPADTQDNNQANQANQEAPPPVDREPD